MRTSYVVGLSDRGAALLREGKAIRTGGVLRGKGGHIIEFLNDGDGDRIPGLMNSLVPAAVQGVTMIVLEARLRSIERELCALRDAVDSVAEGVTRANVKLDAGFFGPLAGALQACHFELAEGRADRLCHYREEFLASHHSFARVLKELFAPQHFRRCSAELRGYLQAWAIAGIAARDVTLRLGEEESAMSLTEQLQQEAAAMSSAIDALVTAPSALFWQTSVHLSCQAMAREVRARLDGHSDFLRSLRGGSTGQKEHGLRV